MVVFGVGVNEDDPNYGLLYKQDCFKNRINLQDNESIVIARFLPTEIFIASGEGQINFEITNEMSEKIIQYKLTKPSYSDSWYNFLICSRHIQRVSAFLSGVKLPIAFLYFDKPNAGPHFVSENDYRVFPLFDETSFLKENNGLLEKMNELLCYAEKDYFIKRAVDLSGEAILQWFEDPEATLLNAWRSIEILAKRRYLYTYNKALSTKRILLEIYNMFKDANITYDKSKITNYYDLRGYAAHGLPRDYDSVKDFETEDLEKLKEISNNTCFEVIKLSRLIIRNILKNELNFY